MPEHTTHRRFTLLCAYPALRLPCCALIPLFAYHLPVVRLPCCVLIFLRTYPAVPLFFFALNFLRAYPPAPVFFDALPAVPTSRLSLTTYPAVPLSALRLPLTLLCLYFSTHLSALPYRDDKIFQFAF